MADIDQSAPAVPPEEEPGRKLLELLVCPLTKGPLEYDRARRELISRKARVAYPIRNGVALMTAEAARTLDDTGSPAGTGTTPQT